MQDGKNDFLREAKRHQPVPGSEGEGLRPLDADERGETAEMMGEAGGLFLKLARLGLVRADVGKSALTLEANAGRDAGKRACHLHDTLGSKLLIRAEQGAQDDLIRAAVRSLNAQGGRRHLTRRAVRGGGNLERWRGRAGRGRWLCRLNDGKDGKDGRLGTDGPGCVCLGGRRAWNHARTQEFRTAKTLEIRRGRARG